MILSTTGHRPDKLLGYGQQARDMLRAYALRVLLYYQTKADIEHVIGGMALGWDTAWVEAATIARIPFIAAVPFVGQEQQWQPEDQTRYSGLLRQAKRVIIVNDGGYHPAKMHCRNEWMVNHSDKLIALWNGSRGGTANAVRHAEIINKPWVNIWPHFKRTCHLLNPR